MGGGGAFWKLAERARMPVPARRQHALAPPFPGCLMPWTVLCRECRFASLVQCVVDPGHAQPVAMVLACLDSVYNAECQQLAAEAISALATANQV